MKNKEIIIGVVVGILATAIGTLLYLVYLTYSRDTTLGVLLAREIKYGGIHTDIAWGTALNFLAFYGFLKTDKEEHAKGVMIITVLIALCVMTYRLFN